MKSNKLSTYVIFYCLLLGSTNLQAVIDIRDCNNPCTADDVEVLEVFIGDANGNKICDCTPGQTIPVAKLFVTISVNNNGNRHSWMVGADLFQNGQDTGDDFIACDPTLYSDMGTFILEYPLDLTLVCGESYSLSNMTIGWHTTLNKDCDDCVPGGQCDSGIEIDIIVPLVPDFEWECGSPTPKTIAFTSE
ncbi:MAG: hypothetical protein OEQ53_22640, partial [Saprospiraceae bacterium]|nr:hypothetical protein [Saprospiraceae bacterium]